jgi:hypothetical protein
VPADVVAGLPVREFRWYKGRQHYSGWYWSAMLGRLVAYESRLELARIMLADFDPSVTGIAAQPFLLTGADGIRRGRRPVPAGPLQGRRREPQGQGSADRRGRALVICFNPEAAERDAAIRARMIAQLEEAIRDSGQLSVGKRAELAVSSPRSRA